MNNLDISKKDICVVCRKEVPCDIDTPIEYRNWYLHGTGQLCKACYKKIYNYEKKAKNYKYH